MKRTFLTSVGVVLLLTGCGESAADREAQRQEEARQAWKKIDEGNARALREKNLRPTWKKKTEEQ